jgi:hypothetical protein
MKRIIIISIAAVSGLFALAGCGGPGTGGPGAQRGPAGAAAFAGTTVRINPTLRFLAGGAVQYTNTTAGSPFPPAPVAINGTYTYTPSADFTTGSMTMQFPGALTIALALSQFEATAGNITRFRATYLGTPYVATVTSGTLPAAPAPGTPPTGEQPATDIPAGVRGTHPMVFAEAASGSGLPDGSTETFLIGADTLAFGGDTLSNPVFRSGNTGEWIFKSGSLEYAVSQTPAGILDEINVTGPGGSPFYGQYTLAGGGPGDTITLLPNGNLPPGTTVTLPVTGVSGTPPANVPLFALGQLVTFTVGSAGNLLVGDNGLDIPFNNASPGSVTYFESVGGFDNNQAILGLDETTNVPVGAALTFSRAGGPIVYSFN